MTAKDHGFGDTTRDNRPAAEVSARAITVEVVETKVVNLDMPTAAAWFCGLTDEQQADFFIEVARQAEKWEHHQSGQWWLVGAHLRNCECSTDEARELVRNLAHGLDRAS